MRTSEFLPRAEGGHCGLLRGAGRKEKGVWTSGADRWRGRGGHGVQSRVNGILLRPLGRECPF